MNSSAIDTSTNTNNITDTQSNSSRSRGSAVLARAREYNRIIDEKNRSRSKSYERNNHSTSRSGTSGSEVGEEGGVKNISQRERAMAKIQASSNTLQDGYTIRSTKSYPNSGYRSSLSPSEKSTPNPTSYGVKQQQQQQQQQQQSSSRQISPTNPVTNKENLYRDKEGQHQQPATKESIVKSKTNSKSKRINTNHPKDPQSNPQQQQQQQQVVTPELLVDALSGHEDGLLAIAERLMEHYDSGYDVMGEAIIDAFADVQKLFQHVVEAAHMEGAAYEAGRREEEIEKLKRALGGEGVGAVGGEGSGGLGTDDHVVGSPTQTNNGNSASSSPMRHEEFVDQDVRDVLAEAIRKGQSLKDGHKYTECYHLFEQACNSASALLPVDSDHRGRLQLSIARAESMNAERACAILKYVMDDVLRSGLTSNSKIVMPDPSQRGDCVLSRPPPKSKIIDEGENVVLQSSEEALASMVEEMKEILSAPVYDNSPLQTVADKFWTALNESQRNHSKTEERLEQKLGELKGDFLLAKMEWEEKYNRLSRECDKHKKQAERIKMTRIMEQARSGVSSIGGKDYDSDRCDTTDYPPSLDSPKSGVAASSVASSLPQYARSIVSSFSCNGGEYSDKVKKYNGSSNISNRINKSPLGGRKSPLFGKR